MRGLGDISEIREVCVLSWWENRSGRSSHFGERGSDKKPSPISVSIFSARSAAAVQALQKADPAMRKASILRAIEAEQIERMRLWRSRAI